MRYFRHSSVAIGPTGCEYYAVENETDEEGGPDGSFLFYWWQGQRWEKGLHWKPWKVCNEKHIREVSNLEVLVMCGSAPE